MKDVDPDGIMSLTEHDLAVKKAEFQGMRVEADAAVPKGEIRVKQGRRVVKKIVNIGPGPSEAALELEEERLP